MDEHDIDKLLTGKVPSLASPLKDTKSVHSSQGSINSTGTGLSVTMKAVPIVETNTEVTLSGSPMTHIEDKTTVVTNFRNLATGFVDSSQQQLRQRNGSVKTEGINNNVEDMNNDTDNFNNDENDEGRVRRSSSSGTEMLSYRKSRKGHNRGVSTGSVIDKSLPELPQTPTNGGKYVDVSVGTDTVRSTSSFVQGEYDRNLYVDERYMDTQYRYASERRNSDFHTLFTNVPLSDRLLDDFCCALSREILLQGRIYISEHHICFNSSLLGWVTTLVFSHNDIKNFEKRMTAGIFPNGIVIHTKDAVHTFASFLTRDQTLNFIETIWSKSVALNTINNGSEELIESKSYIGRLSEQDIFTIDGDSSSNEYSAIKEENASYEDSDEESVEEDAVSIESSNEIKTSINLKTPSIAKANGSLKASFSGPKSHEPTKHDVDYNKNKERVVLECEFDVPMGFLFKLLFGNDIQYHRRIMEIDNGSNFSTYSGIEKDRGKRTFEYDKGLNYPVGPKSTRVYTEEKIEHLDFNDYIEVMNITKTPNVPSGGAFDCRTRYVFCWGENSMTKFTASYYLNWTGSSWIKSVIESSVLAGQQKSGKDIKLVLDEAIEERKKEVDNPVEEKIVSRKRKTRTKVHNGKHSNKKAPKKLANSETVGNSLNNNHDLILKRLKYTIRLLVLIVILELIIIIGLGLQQREVMRHIDELRGLIIKNE